MPQRSPPPSTRLPGWRARATDGVAWLSGRIAGPAHRPFGPNDTSRQLGIVGHISSQNGDSQVQPEPCYASPMSMLPSVRNAILRVMEADGGPQCLAMEVVSQPRDQRDGLIRGLRTLYCEGIARSGQSRQTVGMLGDVLEAKLREQVADIEARGGGTVGTA